MSILKSKKGASCVELIVWATVIMLIFTMFFLFKEPIKLAFANISPNVVAVESEETGKVVEKNIVPGYRGSRNYLVAVQTEDENIVEVSGKELYYKVSVGDEVELEKTVLKNKKTKAIINEDYEMKG